MHVHICGVTYVTELSTVNDRAPIASLIFRLKPSATSTLIINTLGAGAPVRYLTSNIQMLETIALWQCYHFDLQLVAIGHSNAMLDWTLNLLCGFHCSDKERTERYLSR
ncbi:hypothetical protein AZE42_06744 [Rhizopogon vesiculosus]|uniref:Uncharacterized protein n=1 Tax=Rhizopogon vesiculosus TaxID=180088 RepID=A0A1J8QM23_9AGAM|nr:hypothetical protein AZE42_06744 [Rhizopogon vesiculosus]